MQQMDFPVKLNNKDFFYDLPDNRIAKYPSEVRDASKLLVYNHGNINSFHFSDLPSMLNPGHYLVFNDTKVIMARLLFNKESGAGIEVFLLEPCQPADYAIALNERKKSIWKCLVGNAKKWKSGSLSKTIKLNNTKINLNASVAGKMQNSRIIAFEWDDQDITFSDILKNAGLTPIPPYLRREAEEADKERYQTIYSCYEGSVAAPTAGLHFTPEILKKLKAEGIMSGKITLHVGAGTFLPVKGDNIFAHDMHIEHFSITKQGLQEIINAGRQCISVGTTTVRALESLYWLGIKLKADKTGEFSFYLDQWEPYKLKGENTRQESLKTILTYMQNKGIEQVKASTKIMIMPGYKFKMTDGMITNFHQPCSTLLLLVAAFIGDDWKKVYNYALKNDFRFLSYGDSSLLFGNFNHPE